MKGDTGLLTKNWRVVLGTAATVSIAVSGCGGGSGSTPQDSVSDCEVFVGRLVTDETLKGVGCGWEDHTESQVYVISQNECEISVTTNSGIFTGVADGSELSWETEYPYEQGTMSVLSSRLDVSRDIVEGATTWNWSGDDGECSGTSRVSGVFHADDLTTTPRAPSDLVTRSITSRLINLSWVDQSDNETGFTLDRSSVSATAGYEVVVALAENVESYDDLGLDPSTTYWYRIGAGNTAGISDYSDVEEETTLAPVAPVPLAPSDIAGIATSSASVYLSWTDHSSHEDGFSIERRNISELGPFGEIATLSSNSVSFDDGGLDASTEYLYRVRAYNGAGYSAYSNTGPATTWNPPVVIPLAPSDLLASSVSSSTINLTWFDQSNNEDGYIIERSEVAETSGFIHIAALAADVVSFDDTALNPATSYWYRIHAFNSAGNSAYTNTGNAVTEVLDPQCHLPANCQFLVGAGIYDVTGPAAELGMMGYSDPLQRTAGIHTRLYSRAYILGEETSGRRVVFVSADLLSITNPVRRGVMEKLHARYGARYSNNNVMLTATHTHSGPGGYSGYPIYDFAILGFHRQNYNAIVEGIYQSIVRAHENMKPGKIKMNRGLVEEASFNRSDLAYKQNPDRLDYADFFDKDMVLLRLEGLDGSEIGMINWFAVHPTNIGNTNRLISSDNKGLASYLFEKSKDTNYRANETFVAAFAQSNAGDVSPNLWGHPDGANDYARMEIIGRRMLDRATELYDQATTYLNGTIDYRHRHLDLSKSGGFVSTGKTCVGAIGLSVIGGSHEDGVGLEIVPEGFVYGIDWPSFTLLPEDQACHREKIIVLPTGRLRTPYAWTPDIVPIQMIKIGNLALIGLPVEATTMTGRRARSDVLDVLDEIGVDTVVFAGYANDYAGYIATREEYALQHYEGASTFFGPDSEQVFRSELVKLAAYMRDDSAVPTRDSPPDVRRSAIGFVPGVIFDDKPLFKGFGDVEQNAKANYGRGEKVKVVFWGAHPKNDLRAQDTFLEIQKKQGGSWVTVARDNDPTTRYRWRRNFIAYSLVTTEWDIPIDADSGDYRIVHRGNWKNVFGKISGYSGYSRVFSVN